MKEKILVKMRPAPKVRKRAKRRFLVMKEEIVEKRLEGKKILRRESIWKFGGREFFEKDLFDENKKEEISLNNQIEE